MRMLTVSLILFVSLGLLACAATTTVAPPPAKPGPSPSVVAESSVVPLDKKGKVTFMGSGFQPEQELRLLLKTADGVMTDIGSRLDPKPIANERGAWATEFSYGRFVSKKLIKEGAYAILVADRDYNIMASAPIRFKQESTRCTLLVMQKKGV